MALVLDQQKILYLTYKNQTHLIENHVTNK